MVITSNFVSQKAFIKFLKLQPQTNQTKKIKKIKNEKLQHFEPKN